AMLAFCSISSTVTPWRLISRMMEKMSCTTSGARPRDGSSSIISFGRDIRARPTASICCSPPERVPA
ncbi:Cellulose biosynthesis protein BcsF, partial [Dysosmobacter welbionis]